MPQVASFGTCQLCGTRKPKAGLGRHLKTCAPSHDGAKANAASWFQLRIEDRFNAVFWLDLEVKAEAKLRQLDDFLRRIWLECCGHMSAFHINGLMYSVAADRSLGPFREERSMNHRFAEVVGSIGQRFRYEYDFGSTTELMIRVWGRREGIVGRSPVRLLARNDAPVWPCNVCQEPATLICAYCVHEGEPFYCAKHAPEHGCADDEPFLPVVNSPRMGVCGYTGEA